MHTHSTPAEAANTPALDAFLLLNRIAQREKAQAQFQAALAGAKLK